MANTHLEFCVAITIIRPHWSKMTHEDKVRFSDEAASRFGAKVIHETAETFKSENNHHEVLEFIAERLA